uniref:Uncharacterized protein n=2 Tax=Schizophyllum commune (strain H4-8 / FGSC 9210) TaxID=578458 RepID=D8Q476_SCHCM
MVAHQKRTVSPWDIMASRHVGSCRSPPATLLPAELLIEIFKHTLPDVHAFWKFGAPFGFRPHSVPPSDASLYLRSPVVLIAVCRRWKAIAEGAPELWTRVFVDDFERRELHWAALHVKHSVDRPLTVHINTCKGNKSVEFWREKHPLFTQLLHIVVPHAHRWHELVLHAKWFTQQHFDILLSASVPSLQSARIVDGPSYGVEDEAWRWALSSPALRCAALAILPPLDVSFGSWRSVREFSICNTASAVAHILLLLHICPQIEVLHLETLGDAETLLAQLVPRLPLTVSAPNLRTLSMTLSSVSDAREFVERLRDVPCLRDLALNDDSTAAKSQIQTRFWSSVGNLLVRSGAKLQRFVFTGRVQQLVDLLQLEPLYDLQELSACRMAVPSRFTDMLTIDDTKRWLPHLAKLSLGTCWSDPRRTLDNMVLSRKGILRALHIQTLAQPYDTTILKEAGKEWLALTIGP